MPIDLDAAERFIWANARLLERHRLLMLLHDAPAAPLLAALRAYRNDDGGFGHALEPDVRAPGSEPVAAFAALELLAEAGALADPMTADLAAWVATIADDDGGLPNALPASAAYPHAPWMEPAEGASVLTWAIAARLWEAGGVGGEWLPRASAWCWAQAEGQEPLGGYGVKFALDFLDHVPQAARAQAAIERLRGALRPDGTIPVAGGTADEQLTPLVLSPRSGRRSRALFADALIEAELDALEAGQQEDGGWTFDWLGWSPGQTVEWRGRVTLEALATLRGHGRI